MKRNPSLHSLKKSLQKLQEI
uniref:Uncharacterized protein n=1 Tax=Tetranychus urticae TaxID=32264 RepID=T1KXB5_TETUR